jgi:uncharacterized protein (TIGR02271 family)
MQHDPETHEVNVSMVRRKREVENTTAPDRETRPIPRVEERPGRAELKISLAEEQLTVRKTSRKAGELVLRREVTEQVQTVPVDLNFEEVQVERVTVNRPLPRGRRPVPRQEGDTLIVPIVEEEIVVSKRLIVREEVRITKRRLERHEEISDTVRKQELHIESLGDVQKTSDAS